MRCSKKEIKTKKEIKEKNGFDPSSKFESKVVNNLSNGSVSWSLATKPAVFGNDIELHCNLDNDTSLNGSRHWSKGDNVKVLVVNGKTINDTKYSEELDKAKRTSILTITSLDTGDVNVPYTCQHGFQTYKKVLNMTVENFECKYF
ncbi:Hypothetical predicted protein [Mytilus galloprovincialis]|uniref:Ig-like domain-containing protein n=1 Tax=Mytilus galloprovincialis TaxID=29158 RepID=A0A8B6E518_MYTGA|nr:Hypothetical predicted protein [Mytilus galloprovincialis]